MLIIGERIDATRRYIAQAISSRNRGFIQSEAQEQAMSGADYINVNASIFTGEEAGHLLWVIEAVQEVTDLPLCIDSPDPGVIQAALSIVKKKSMINAITLETGRMEGMLPLVLDHRAKVIASCQAEGSNAETSDAKVRIASRLIERIAAAGVQLDDLYIDPLVYSLSTNAQAARATLDAVEMIMRDFPGVHTTLCLGTVSYGLPARSLLHRTFLAMAVERGLDSAIIDPADRQLFATLKAAELIAGREECSLSYIGAFRKGRLE